MSRQKQKVATGVPDLEVIFCAARRSSLAHYTPKKIPVVHRVHLLDGGADVVRGCGADCHSKKTGPGANIFFQPYFYTNQGISRYHTIWTC
jgi:hypothetical protein